MSNAHPPSSNLKTTVNIQPILSVLELKSSITPNDLTNLKEEEMMYYDALPQVDKQKIDKLKKDLQMFSQELVLSHLADEYNVPLFKSIEVILKINEQQKQFSKPMATLIFFNLISIIYFNEQVSAGTMTLIIKSLIKCLSSYQGLSTSFFQNLINKNLESLKSDLDKAFLQTVFEFIKLNTTLDGTFYQSFTSLCKLSFDLNDEQLTSDTLDLILYVFTEKRSFIKKDDQSQLLESLKPFLDKDEPKIFQILSTISMVTKCQAINNIYSCYGSTIVDKFSSYPITIGDQNDCGSFPSVEITNRDQYAFVGTEFHTFPTGFKPLPQQFYEDYDMSQHFPSDLWNFTNKINLLLKGSSMDATDAFFTQLMSQIQAQNNPELFYTNLAILLLFLKENATPSRLISSKDYLISEKVFNVKHVVFNEGGLDPIINDLRNNIVQILADKDPQIMMEILKKENIYLFVELIGRLLAISSQLDNFSTFKSFFTDIIDVSTLLQAADFQLHSDKLAVMRSVIFLFAAKLAKFSTFLEPNFVKGFANFMFEIDITDQILFIFKLNFSLCRTLNKYLPVVERFSTILHICASRCINDERYWTLAYKIADMLNTSLKHSQQTIELAYQLFDVIFQCFKVKPIEDFLLLIISLLKFISSWKENYSLNVEKITFISSFIKSNQLFSKAWHVNFLCLLSNCSTLSPKENLFNEFYFIERPQFILFFLSSFGTSPLFCHYLMNLSLNCQFSPYNARNFHDGCLDIVLLRFLAEGKEECTVSHRGISMDLKIPAHYQKKCIFPFLISMFSAKTSYSVVALLHKLCRMKNIDFLTVFESAMAECALRHTPYYLISSLPIDSHSNDISITSNQFSFSFWFKFDAERIVRTRPEITFFSLTDKTSTLSLTFKQNLLLLTYENPKYTPPKQANTKQPAQQQQQKIIGSRLFFSYPLTDKSKSYKENIVFSNQWHFVALSFAVVNGKQSMKLILDDENMNQKGKASGGYSSELIPISFSKGKLELKLGTVQTNDPQRCHELGYIAEFCFYPRFLKNEEFHEFYLQKPHTDQELVEIISKSQYFHSKTLLDIYDDHFVLQQFINSLCIVLKPDFLYPLKYILESVSQQLAFSMTDDILDCVLRIEPRDSSLYLTVYSIFEVIIDEHLQEEWITTLIFNILLWMRCDHVSKYIILCHWTSTLLQKYAPIFKSMSKFSDALLSFDQLFDDSENESRQEYIKLLSKLAFLNFSPENSNDLFSVAFSSWNKPSFKFYLKLIRNIANIIALEQRKKIILYIHSILEKYDFTKNDKNNEMIHEFLMTLHDLSSLTNDVMESTILLRMIPKIKIKKDVLFNILLNNLNDFPGFYPLLCGFAAMSQLNEDEQVNLEMREKIPTEIRQVQKSLFPLHQLSNSVLSKNATPIKNQLQQSSLTPTSQPTRAQAKASKAAAQQNAKSQTSTSTPLKQATSSIIGKGSSSLINSAEVEDKDYKLKMMYGELWYFWPIILIFKINNSTSKFAIYDILAHGTNELGSQSEKIALIQNISSLLTYISAGLQIFNQASKYLIALHDLIPPNETQVLSEIVNQLVYISFYCISPHTHNSILIRDFLKSPYFLPNSNISYAVGSPFPTIKLDSISDVDEFASERKAPSIGIEHIFDEKENFVAFPAIQIAMKVLNDTKIKSEYTDIINYFAQKKNDGSCNKYPNLFDKIRNVYSDQFASVTIKLFGVLSKSLKESKSSVGSVSNVNFDQIENDAANLIVPLKDLQPRPQLTNMLDFCRSRILSPDYPTKIKKRLFSRPRRKNISYQMKKPDLTISNANLINIRKSRHCEFQSFKECIKIIVEKTEKMIKMSDIKSVFLFDSSFEIHTNLGRSYCVDFGSQNTILVNKCFSDYQIAKPSPFKWTSNFEYLMYLNFLSGRSFNKQKNYPIFPNVLYNFSDYICRNIAGLKVEGGKIKSPDMDFLHWNGSIYAMADTSISSIIERESFLPPEFYYFPELFGDCKLPPWASSKFEFVYKMRKLLESPSVTKNLPKWIDIVWYEKEYVLTKYDHKVIFHTPHQQKESCIPPYPKIGQSVSEILKSSPIVFSFCYKKSFGVISKDNQIHFFSITFDNNQINFKKTRVYTLEKDVSKYVFFSTNNIVNAFNKDTMNLTKYDSKNIIEDKTIYCEIPVFTEFDKSFVYSEDFSTIRTEEGTPIRSENEITCFAASARFGILAYATVDNVVHVCNIPKSKSDIPKKLTGIPLRLLITDSWGFVIVQTQGQISVFNQNCELIKTVKFEYDINYWTTFRSASGFDYILFRYRINAICMFEAMYPEHIAFVCEANDMVNVHFIPENETLLIVNKSGKVTVQPISLSSMFK